MAEKKTTNRADAVELVDMALGDLKKVAGQLGIEDASTLKKAELVQSIADLALPIIKGYIVLQELDKRIEWIRSLEILVKIKE